MGGGAISDSTKSYYKIQKIKKKRYRYPKGSTVSLVRGFEDIPIACSVHANSLHSPPVSLVWGPSEVSPGRMVSPTALCTVLQ